MNLTNDYTPTPALSLAVKQKAAGGIVITSSHNPWNWNGVKFKASFGGSATPAIMKAIESNWLNAGPDGPAAAIEELDFKHAYIEAICSFADLDLIASTKFKFAVDAMYGAGRGVLPQSSATTILHIAIRQELNPLFPGINPEPIEPHIELQEDGSAIGLSSRFRHRWRRRPNRRGDRRRQLCGCP